VGTVLAATVDVVGAVVVGAVRGLTEAQLTSEPAKHTCRTRRRRRTARSSQGFLAIPLKPVSRKRQSRLAIVGRPKWPDYANAAMMRG
jgi:hypothetical protein